MCGPSDEVRRRRHVYEGTVCTDCTHAVFPPHSLLSILSCSRRRINRTRIQNNANATPYQSVNHTHSSSLDTHSFTTRHSSLTFTFAEEQVKASVLRVYRQLEQFHLIISCKRISNHHSLDLRFQIPVQYVRTSGCEILIIYRTTRTQSGIPSTHTLLRGAHQIL